jgi:hypothetical protein
MRYAAIAVVITFAVCVLIAAPTWLILDNWRPAALSVFITAFPAMIAADWMLQRLGVKDHWKPPEHSA